MGKFAGSTSDREMFAALHEPTTMCQGTGKVCKHSAVHYNYRDAITSVSFSIFLEGTFEGNRVMKGRISTGSE
ncbi:hypothetical protein PVK06_004668 [Gossypium arboreum]|uniref:Uncharacterized protein n=1 Tax=Gossypium arboreum TaxID=29729 RepID=A0ABR0QTL1_GOSAR|nr:hypothetical protein PVK06_004668 [Gossypium arboreum]